MAVTAIILVVISAVLHAGWNLLSKYRHPTASFFLLANLAGAVLLLPVLILSADVLDCFVSGRVGLLLLATGFFMALYWAALAGAYRAGDMSVAYPLARSSPVIVVTAVTLILGRGDQVSGQCTIGIVLVVAGCFLGVLGAELYPSGSEGQHALEPNVRGQQQRRSQGGPG